ncbi:MAG: outer membrane protein assembly factor BamC, partial [Oxalobacter sp.]|nr:outer membrane protein assembly factor BamC [Oxalobacter sp.]
ITASDYNQQRKELEGGMTSSSDAASLGSVAPNQAKDIHIERLGNQRWLVVNRPPEALWTPIRDFWQDNGFLINIDSPETGIMETDWAENRAKIPQDIIRRTLGKIFDSLYSTGERDKFRTRLERGPNGTTEVYISHRGAEEELQGSDQESTVWTARPADPELEAEFLARLLVYLSDADRKEEKRARAIAEKKTVQVVPKATMVTEEGVARVVVDETFDRAWRRVGLALDHVGFTVVDRDRSAGIYYVRYVDQDAEAKVTPEDQKGWFSGLFSSSKKDKHIDKYQISVREIAGKSIVVVLDDKGQLETSSIAKKIVTLLYGQLK